MKLLVAFRLAAVACIAAYGVLRLVDPLWWDLLDNVSLVIHEAGHVILAPFGDHVGVLGGSLMQLLVPIAFVVHFMVARQRFAAAVTLSWTGQNAFNVATYIADARAQALPLLGGENVIHDWWYLLTEWDLLPHDLTIARVVRLLALASFATAVAVGVRYRRDVADSRVTTGPLTTVASRTAEDAAPPAPHPDEKDRAERAAPAGRVEPEIESRLQRR